MVRKEQDLLNSLFLLLAGANEKNENKEKLTEKENQLIEKYRDKNGYINVKNEKDINKVSKIINLVDKKNYLETLEKNNNLQDLANNIVKDIKEVSGNSIVNVKIETPTQSAYAKSEMPGEIVDPSCKKGSVTTTATSLTMEDLSGTEHKSEKTVVLYNAGGMFNAPFYNAVLYICETQYFQDDDVYTDIEIDENDKVNTHVLLPNIWGKIYANAADEFSGYLAAGEEVYIIDPETFELTKINNSWELWDYAMTLTQEEML